MKEKLKNSPWLRAWFYTGAPLVITRPALKETAACIGCLLAGFLLACGQLGGAAMPFALGFLAAVGGGIRGLTCLIGAVGGYLTMQTFDQGLQMASAGILVYVCAYIFASLWVARRLWFRCLTAGAMPAVVGLIFLLGQQPLTPALLAGYGGRVLLSALSPICYEGLLRGKTREVGTLAALFTFLVGAMRIPLPLGMRLGGVAAVALTASAARRSELPEAAAVAVSCGAAMDGALGAGFWTAALGLGAAVGAGLPTRRRMLRLLGGLGVMAGTAAFFGGGDGVWATLILGGGVSLLLPAGLLNGREEHALAQSAEIVERRLTSGQEVLQRLYAAIGADPEQQQRQNQNRIFDRAAEKVCRRCGRYALCWQRDGQETYALLSPMQPGMLERGSVGPEDFPPAFSQRCRRLEALTQAVNQELTRMIQNGQAQRRKQEDRIIVSRVLMHLGRMLEKNARTLRMDRSVTEEAYRLRLGVAARGRGGARISGDRGANFSTDDGRSYVILCDGMGTGEPAAAESRLAVEALVELIQAGMPPDAAMEMLNGMYILRDSGSFSTMDVLELSLVNGQGVLYKWGAAPSFLKSGETVRRLGAAAPPPGLGVEKEQRAEILRVELWSGDMLALVSDGVLCPEMQTVLRDFQGENVKALASELVVAAEQAGGEDDMTAVVVRLTEL